jgi:membrane-bound lytic murein transglycosylase B
LQYLSTPIPRALVAVLALLAGLQGSASAQTRTDKTEHLRREVLEKVRRADAERQPAYTRRDDVQAYIRTIAARQPQLDPAWIEASLAKARFQASVTRLIMPPSSGTLKDWSAYRARFIEPKRIQAGLEFWRANEGTLAAAEAAWGVPAEIIVGIIGVETFYGRITGTFRVLDALTTLAFDFPSGRSDRSGFYRDELEQLLVLAQREHLDPASLRGSYAGAMGWPQFMPSSWLRYGSDFNDDGHIDLIGNLPDVIGSVANYLAQQGWQRGMPTRYAVTPPTDLAQRARLLVPDIRPTFTAADLQAAGAQLSPAGKLHKDTMALVKLENGGNEPSYVAGTQNFWVVTRYNWSSYYALAVIELGEAIAAEYDPRHVRSTDVLPAVPPAPPAASMPAPADDLTPSPVASP